MAVREYIVPKTVREASLALAEHPWEAKAIAGGTTVVLMMQQGLLAPKVLVDLRGLKELRGISQEGDALRIGAITTLRDVAQSAIVRTHFPSLAQAAANVASVRIRNVATLGGNLAEADYASDPPSVLVSLGAWCRVQGPEARRKINVADLITGFYTTALQPEEVITDVLIPLPEGDQRTVYLKYRSRSSEDRPCVGVAARGLFDQGIVTKLDVVVGAVAPTPQRFPELTGSVTGAELDAPHIDEIAAGYREAIEPLNDLRGSSWYRGQMIEVFTRRALHAIRGTETRSKGADE